MVDETQRTLSILKERIPAHRILMDRALILPKQGRVPRESDVGKIVPIFCDHELHLLNGFWSEPSIREVDDGKCGEYRVSGLVGESFLEFLKALNGFLWSAIREVQQEDLMPFVIEEADARLTVASQIFFLDGTESLALGVSCPQPEKTDQSTKDRQEPVSDDQLTNTS